MSCLKKTNLHCSPHHNAVHVATPDASILLQNNRGLLRRVQQALRQALISQYPAHRLTTPVTRQPPRHPVRGQVLLCRFENGHGHHFSIQKTAPPQRVVLKEQVLNCVIADVLALLAPYPSCRIQGIGRSTLQIAHHTWCKQKEYQWS